MIGNLNIRKVYKKCIAIMCILVLFTPSFTFTTVSATFTARKYNFTDDQIKRIASMCYAENGSSENAMRAEASLMANLYEKNGDKQGTTSGFITYITTGGWFASSSVNKYNNPYENLSSTYLSAVRDVLVNGNRYFPVYVDEHDWLGDITSASNNGVSFDPYDRSKYIKDVTIIKNRYGSTYTFYCFPDSNSDPFGYISINTNSGVLTSIQMKTSPTKTNYYVGEALNTQGISFVAKYSNGTEQILTTGYSCTPTTFNKAGVQQVTLTYNGKTTTFNVNVSKRTIDMSGVEFQNKTVTYNGQAQSIQIEGNLPQGVSVKYEGNGKVDVGEYTVTARFEVDTNKYNAIPNQTAILKIEKANPKVTPQYNKDKKLYEGGKLPQISLAQGDTPGIIEWEN